MRAGTAVSTATTATVPITTAASHQVGGVVSTEPVLSARPRPARSHRDAEQGPGQRGQHLRPGQPGADLAGVAPSERATADERRASTTIAQVMSSALTAARATSATVKTISTWLSRSTRGSASVEPELCGPGAMTASPSLATGNPGAASPVPIQPPAGVRYAVLASGGATSYALTTSGDVYAWGVNRAGEVGDGGTRTAVTPVRVDSGATVISSTAGNVVAASTAR